MADLHRYGATVDPDQLTSIVAGFRTSAAVIAGLVLPWDRAALAEDLDLAPDATTAGSLWTATAECAWRLEGQRGVVTVLSDAPIAVEDLSFEVVTCEVADDPPVQWHHAPFSRGARVAGMHPRTYLIDGVPAHRRLVAEEA